MHTQDDAFHSGAKPMERLKGGMQSPHIQAPATSEAMTNPRSASEDNVGSTSWADTSLKEKAANNPANANKVH